MQIKVEKMKETFRREVIDNLQDNILPYWMHSMVDAKGGFYGRRDGNDELDPSAPKGAILNARILWASRQHIACWARLNIWSWPSVPSVR